MPIGKKIIYGCESSGDGDSAYLTRYTLIDTRWFQVCLHIFHRSDADELHDHPWPFASLILWRGYIEITPYRVSYRSGPAHISVADQNAAGLVRRKRKVPGMVLFRSAEHAHRVELVNGKRSVSLVFMGKKKRGWGFFTPNGWQFWKDYFRERGC